MRTIRLMAAMAALTFLSSTLTGCERSGRFPSLCITNLDENSRPGVIEVKYRVPTRVSPGQTFRVTVDFMVGYIDQPTYREGGYLEMNGPVEGPTQMAAWPETDQPEWPFEFDFTVTGQSGETIDFVAAFALSQNGPDGGPDPVVHTLCRATDLLLQRIEIV